MKINISLNEQTVYDVAYEWTGVEAHILRVASRVEGFHNILWRHKSWPEIQCDSAELKISVCSSEADDGKSHSEFSLGLSVIIFIYIWK